MNQLSAVLEQLEPLIEKLNDSERLELIRSISVGHSKPANGTSATENDFMAEMIAEQSAWYTRPSQERRQYSGEFVAIYQGNIVDHDPDRLSLLRRVRKQYGNAPIPVLSAEQEAVPEYKIHRPQLVS